MTVEIWKEYSFLIGTLPRLQEKILEFKRLRALNYVD